MIRRAEASDLDRLTEWAGRFHGESGMAAPFDADHTREFLRGMMGNPQAVILTHGRGMIGGVVFPAWFAKDWPTAIEAFWWAERDGMPLLRAFEAWARDMGAREIRMSTLTAQPRAARILARRGYRPAETSHSKVITWR